MPIKALIFDMDDVLCRYDDATRIKRLSALSGVGEAHIRKTIWESDYFDRADRGEWTAEGCLAEFGARLGYPLTRTEWIEARRVAMTPFADMLAFVARVRQIMPIALLTNNDRLLGETLDDLFPQLRPLFAPHLYVSAELDLAKPDPAIFRHVVARLGMAPHETLFVDDLRENVDGARKAGLHAELFDGYAAFRQAMQAYEFPADLMAE